MIILYSTTQWEIQVQNPRNEQINIRKQDDLEEDQGKAVPGKNLMRRSEELEGGSNRIRRNSSGSKRDMYGEQLL